MSVGFKDVYTHGYSTIDHATTPRLQKVLELAGREIGTSPQARVLDVGCGAGQFAAKLGEVIDTKHLFGLDISDEAAKLAADLGVTASALDVDQGDFPFESGSFDFVYCGSLIEVVLDPDHLLQELHRVLAPSGLLILTFPNLAAWASRIAVSLGYQPYYGRVSRKYTFGKMMVPTQRGDSTGFIRLLTTKSFRTFAELYGFEIVSYHGMPENNLPRVMQPIDVVLSKMPSLAFQVVSLMRKKQ